MRVFVGVMVALVSTLAQAAPVFVSGTGRCPNPPTLSQALRAHLTRVEVVDHAEPDAVPVVVVDLGSRFRVSVGGQGREFDDAARDCVARVATATVFVALVVEPPISAVPPSTAPPSTTPPSTPSAAPPEATASPPEKPPAARFMQPFEDEPPTPPRPMPPPPHWPPWLELQAALGTSVGILVHDEFLGNQTDIAYQGNQTYHDYEPIPIQQTGYAPQYLHAVLGAAVRIRPHWSFGLRARIGAPIGNNATSVGNAPLGNPVSPVGADLAMLANMRVSFLEGPVHPFISFGAGGGWIHHLLQLSPADPASPYVDATTAHYYTGFNSPAKPGQPVNRVCAKDPCVDTVMMGYGFLTGSFGMAFDLVREPKTPVRLLVETEVQLAGPVMGANFDFRLGLEVALFAHKR